MKFIYLTFIAMLIATTTVAMPINRAFNELNDKSISVFCHTDGFNEEQCIESNVFTGLEDIDLRSNDLLIFKMMNRFFNKSNLKTSKVVPIVVEMALPAEAVLYQRLPAIDYMKYFTLIEPENVNQIEVMIAISEFRLFPNIADEQVTISLNYLLNTEVRVYNSEGRLVTKILNRDIDKLSVILDISNYPAGLYSASDSQSTFQFEKK